MSAPERLLEQPKQRLSLNDPSQILLHTWLLLKKEILGGLSILCRYPARMYVLNFKKPFNLLAAVKYFG